MSATIRDGWPTFEEWQRHRRLVRVARAAAPAIARMQQSLKDAAVSYIEATHSIVKLLGPKEDTA